MIKVLDMQFIRYVNLFNKITGVRCNHCFEYNNAIVFAVPRYFVMKAIGKDSSNLRRLSEAMRKKIKIVAISAKSKSKKRKFKIDKNIFYSNPIKIISEIKPDILFEVIGQPDGISKRIVELALKNKIHVITPNKALIAKHGNNLARLAEQNKVNLEFEASVAGGIPILRTIKEGLATNKISKIYGILNGTTNYILYEMENSNQNFSEVLKKYIKMFH